MLPKVNGKEIDFWGSSLKKGRVIYTTPGMDIGGRFVDTAEQVNYASILLSSLRSKPVQIEATVLVVEDGEMGTGDCSGFARPIILQTCLEHDRKQQLDRQASGLVPSLPAQECEVAQFRMALEDCQLVKGVIQPGETGNADFVLPLSCFKGRQPEPGLHTWTVYFGIRDWAMPRPAVIGYQVLQWFSEGAIEQDVLPLATIDAGYLAETARRRDWSADFLTSGAELPGECDEEDTTEFRTALEQLMAADTHGVMMAHPWVQGRLRDLMRRRWWQLATSGGCRGTALMAIPDDSLLINQVRCGDMPLGEVLVTRYPVPTGDSVKVLENVGTSPYGTVAMSHSTALLFQGDFDGDLFVLRDTKHIPFIARECKARQVFHQTIEMPKDKGRRNTPLEERHGVAQRAMRNAAWIGRAANLITRAQAWDSPRKVKAILWIAGQLQNAIDGLKWNVEVNERLLAASEKEIPPLEWLKLHKQQQTWSKDAPPVSDPGPIALLWNEMSQWFDPFQEVQDLAIDWGRLVPAPVNVPLNDMVRYMVHHVYSGPIAAASRLKDPEQRDMAVKEACKSWRMWCEGVPYLKDGKVFPGLEPDAREMVFKELWHVSIEQKNSAVFVGMLDLVAEVVRGVVPEALEPNGIRLVDGRVLPLEMGHQIMARYPGLQVTAAV